MKFTDASIRALKPKPARYEAWETNGKGFGLRISPAGRKTFIYMYRFEGTARRMTLGTYPALTLSQAHEIHAKAKLELERGTDPNVESVQVKKQAREAHTVKELVHVYVERYAKKKKRSWKEDERVLNKDVVSRWGRRKASSITKQEVVALLDEIMDRAEAIGGKGIQANRTLEIVRKMFNFAFERSIVEKNPCMGIGKPAEESGRDRKLSEEEIGIFWNNLDKSRMNKGMQLLLKLQLVTMQRKGELAKIEKSELDLKTRWWSIPKEKSKNKHSHKVWLTNTALDLIEEAWALSGDSRWLFPGRVKDRHITPEAVGQALLDAQTDNPRRNSVDVFNIPKFVPHDLRRTATTHTPEAGVSRFIVSKVLNHIHVDKSITGKHYDLYEYDKEKREALETWERKLRSIVF